MLNKTLTNKTTIDMKKTKALILSLLLLVCFGGAQAKDYNASLFGIKSNGIDE